MPTTEYDSKAKEDLWIQTFSGEKFYYLRDTTDGIEIGDIAHALSMVSRYTGHCARPFSVGEHSLLVLSIADSLFPCTDERQAAINRWHALMHDSTEAFVADLAAPLKSVVAGYRDLEHSVWERIARRFNVTPCMDPVIKQADWIALYVEVLSLQPNTDPETWERSEDFLPIAREWIKDIGPIPMHMPHPLDVKNTFLGVFNTLYEELPDDTGFDYNATDLADGRV